MLKQDDSLQITRYLIDKMGEGNEVGWLSVLNVGSDEDISEYGMSMDMLNRMTEWSNMVNLIDCKGVDGMDRLGW
jgi:hypothetical protein